MERVEIELFEEAWVCSSEAGGGEGQGGATFNTEMEASEGRDFLVFMDASSAPGTESRAWIGAHCISAPKRAGLIELRSRAHPPNFTKKTETKEA